ncbi:MAG: hypothetical protein SNJ83_10730, partial [Aggregatilineales bacterium]
MAQDTRDNDKLEPAEQEPNAESTKATGTLSTDEVKLASKPSIIRPLRPPSSETKTASLNPVDGESPVKFDLPRTEAVPHRPDALPERPLAKPDPTRETAVLSDNNPILKRMMSRSTQGGTSRLGEGREVLLVIRGMVERVTPAP